MPDWPTMSPLFSSCVAGHLRVADFADVAEQVRRQRSVGYCRVGTSSTTTSGSSESSRRAVTAATCASVASWTIGDRPIRRLAAVTIDDLADAALRRSPSDERQQADGPVRVLRVLADDRNAVRVPVLDEHAAVRSKTTPRGARSASVRWWLFSAISSNFACCTTCSTQKLTARIENTTVIEVLEARVSASASDCDAVPQADAMTTISRSPHRRSRVRLSAAARRRPGQNSANWKATTPTTAFPIA